MNKKKKKQAPTKTESAPLTIPAHVVVWSDEPNINGDYTTVHVTSLSPLKVDFGDDEIWISDKMGKLIEVSFTKGIRCVVKEKAK